MDNSKSSNGCCACIGGVLGKQSLIAIEGCIVESVGTEKGDGVVSYHNCILDNAESRWLFREIILKKERF